MERTDTNPVKSKRDLAKERMQGRYPDMNFDDDDVFLVESTMISTITTKESPNTNSGKRPSPTCSHPILDLPRS